MARPSSSVLLTTLRLCLLALLALTVLLGTSLLCAAGVSLFHDAGFATPGNLTTGLLCALVVWLFVTVFHLRHETVTVPAADGERFLQSARLLLNEMGYVVSARGPLELSTRPRFHALLLGGGIHVRLNGTRARLTGPKVCIELLRNRLRFRAHLGRVLQTLRESIPGERLIKRAELRLRVTPEQLNAIRANVIDVLRSTADVVCEVHLLAQSDLGIPESTLEFQVGRWLEQQGIDATVHKHFIQLHRPRGDSDTAVGMAL